MKNKLFAALVAVFLLQTFVQAQDLSDFEKISPQMLHDGELQSPEHHFSIHSPAAEFEWLIRKSNTPVAKTYLSFNRKTNEMLQVIVQENRSETVILNDSFMNKMLQELKLERVHKGFIVTKEGFMRSKIPMEGSYRIKMEISRLSSISERFYWYQYVSYANQTLYVVQTISPLETEPVFLKKAVSTLRISNVPMKSDSMLVKQPVPQKQIRTSEVQNLLERGDVTGAIAYMIGFFAIPVLLIIWLVRKIKNRQKAPVATARVPEIVLSFYDRNGQVRTMNFDKHMIMIGSKTDCDLSLVGLQPIHCRIYLSDLGYFAEDLGGGISINSVKGSGYVQGNDVIEIGNMHVRFSLN